MLPQLTAQPDPVSFLHVFCRLAALYERTVLVVNRVSHASAGSLGPRP